MSFLRGLVLPAALATPLWLSVGAVPIRGWSAIGDFDWRSTDWLFGFFFTLVGLLLIGLPAAFFVQRLNLSAMLKTILLIGMGLIGGGLIALLYVLGLVILADGLPDTDQWMAMAFIAPLGFLPGMIVACVWLCFNFDKLRRTNRSV